MTDHIVPRRGLKPFKQFLPECFGGTRITKSQGKRASHALVPFVAAGQEMAKGKFVSYCG